MNRSCYCINKVLEINLLVPLQEYAKSLTNNFQDIIILYLPAFFQGSSNDIAH